MKSKFLIGVNIIVAIFLFQGCFFSKNLRVDLKIDKESKSVIKGSIASSTKSSKDIYIVLFKHEKGDKKDFKMSSISSRGI